MTTKVDETLVVMNERDWSDASVDDTPRSVTLVQSVRMSQELTGRLFAEAARRGITPSQLIRDLVTIGLREAEESPTVTLRLVDLQQAIEAVAERHAA